jgi:hypothetical protein
MTQTISLMVPTQAQIRPKAFAMSMNKEALTGTNLAFSTRGIALAWMLDIPEAGAVPMTLLPITSRVVAPIWLRRSTAHAPISPP